MAFGADEVWVHCLFKWRWNLGPAHKTYILPLRGLAELSRKLQMPLGGSRELQKTLTLCFHLMAA